ncbi:MAG: 2-methylfumaryl-CoA isomerase [Acidimicrobiaceae bacterium]|jgi:2-methylfumaryl-CoA isomerase|nr:2-methylfumaryl-CoA isomerase [Acidimicrobiaceae bacterium]MBT5580972.1 2-methylfumaryl-CoA isomerase [Acidimicrobiaceae bacterium]MBT5850901.1 2-methylfumaryl-CoA isomerase [Acidimicrobiaceae bacterium]
MIPPLEGLSVVEGTAFVAAPSGGMTLGQLGADVIRFDQIGGGIDYGRWPLTEDGESIYWAGLNKGKRSIAVDMRSDRAKEILTALIADAGTFLTNFPAKGWMSHDVLSQHRDDLISLNITGNRDGSTALDYTVNSAIGYPLVTGPVGSSDPVNHVLPAWDLICGQTAAIGILAADRRRILHGEGAHMSLALSDVALVAVSALGHVAEAQINGTERQRFGNDLYGAYGTTFTCADGTSIYAVGISPKQWSGLLEATDATIAIASLEADLGSNFGDEGERFLHREAVTARIAPWIAEHTIDQVAQRFDTHGVCWGRYQTFTELVESDPRCSTESELFRDVEQPGIGTYLTPGSPVAFGGMLPVEPTCAPRLGEHTEQILSETLGLSAVEIGFLHDDGVVASA